MANAIARTARASGLDVTRVASALIAELGRDPAAVIIVFADWRLDIPRLAQLLQAAFPAVPVVGASSVGVLATAHPLDGVPVACAIALGGEMRAGVGVARDLSRSALANSRDAMRAAATALGGTPDALDPTRYVALTFVDGSCGHEEAFCIGSAAPAPQLKVVGGAAATERGGQRRAIVIANGEALSDAGVVVLIETPHAFCALTSLHLVATDARVVVTAATGRTIEQLDGKPAAARLRELVDRAGLVHSEHPVDYAFARYLGGTPHAQSISRVSERGIELASAIECGHVLQLMRSGDLVATTRRDLRTVIDHIGGSVGAFIAFSCLGRYLHAQATGVEDQMDAAYAEHGVIGGHSFGEHAGMLWVNHTLTGLAFGGS